MVVGGLANAVWGEPRVTLDIDVTVWVEDREIPQGRSLVSDVSIPRSTRPGAFVGRTRVLPLESGEGVRMDASWAPEFERDALTRTIRRDRRTIVRFRTARQSCR